MIFLLHHIKAKSVFCINPHPSHFWWDHCSEVTLRLAGQQSWLLNRNLFLGPIGEAQSAALPVFAKERNSPSSRPVQQKLGQKCLLEIP